MQVVNGQSISALLADKVDDSLNSEVRFTRRQFLKSIGEQKSGFVVNITCESDNRHSGSGDIASALHHEK